MNVVDQIAGPRFSTAALGEARSLGQDWLERSRVPCRKVAGENSDLQRPEPTTAGTPRSQQIVRVQPTRGGKGGKTVTVIRGLQLDNAEIKALLKKLKSRIGSGGTVKEGEIELQGDQVDLALELLTQGGLQAQTIRWVNRESTDCRDAGLGDNGGPNRCVMSSTPTYGQLTNQGASTNIAWHHASVDRNARAEQRGHRSAILWFTGLSGAGKSTLANAVNQALFERGLATYVLDGDNIRHGLCKDLGFSDADREENIRRIGEVAKLFLDSGVIVLTAFVSPFRADRDKARALVEDGDFLEIFCSADLSVCEERDTKGLYAKARAGEIKEFTGISSPYEAPSESRTLRRHRSR